MVKQTANTAKFTIKLENLDEYKKRLSRVIHACEELKESTESLVNYISGSDDEIQLQNGFRFSNEDITVLSQKIDQLCGRFERRKT
ncbi:hypothetical protein [Levyella massiliensis]|uniref:hypothetical protein n=1 Tax=Levyella massiliensis TaxID=938289 RepID=UPI003EB9908B